MPMGTPLTSLLVLLLFLEAISPAAAKSSSVKALSSCEDKATGERILETIDVSSPEQAAQLAEDLLTCPGEDFEVTWQGTIAINRSLEVANGTSLKITGTGQQSEATIEAGGIGPTFAVWGSNLRLDGLTITDAKGFEGGVVAARDGASVAFIDCDILGNTATSKGGAVFLDRNSSFISSGSNFTSNNADLFGGAIFASNGSSIFLRGASTNLFFSNTAKSGGAVYLEEGSTLTVEGNTTDLIGNSADFQGGAIYAERECQVAIGGVTLLAENEAGGSNGGAIFAKDSTVVTTSGNTSFVDNYSSHYGGAIMVQDRSKVVVDGGTDFLRNRADYDGGAIKAEIESVVQINGRTSFLLNSAGDLGGAISADNRVIVSTVGPTRFSRNFASSGGAICSSQVAIVSFQGRTLFDNNTASNDGGALHFMFSRVSIGGSSEFLFNNAMDGSGGALYCNNVNKLTVTGSKFAGNVALRGGAVATFSTGGQPLTSITSSTTSDSSLLDSQSSAISSAVFDLSTPGSIALTVSPVKFLACSFEHNYAEEDGGAIYSNSGYDIIRDSNFTRNSAESSGGACVHSGVVAEVSNSVYEFNRAGKEGPAILSLGLLNSMSDVTFRGNTYFCETGTFSSNTTADSNSCRFLEVCSRCTVECDSELEAGAIVEDPDTIPTCEKAPDGATTSNRGETVETLEILPGYYRSSATSLDIRECFHAEACVGGYVVGEYCAAGYVGPYCAVCNPRYAPGYHHTCKSCIGGNKRRAVAGIVIGLCIALVALGVVVANLVSVVTPRPATVQAGSGASPGCAGEANSAEGGTSEKRDRPTGAVISNRLKETLGVWQHRVAKRFPLTVVKIVVVVWQIVTQYSDVAGVQYPGAYKDFLSIIDMVNLDIGFILSFACVYETTFYDRLLFATLGPIVLLVLLGCTYVIALRRNRGREGALATVRQRHLSVAIFIMFILYGTISHTVFETFVCDEMGGEESYLRADYSLDCTTGMHRAYQVWAAFMVVVYPVGIPCVFGWWLVEHRHDLKDDPYRHFNLNLRPATDLWEPYKRNRYYYEVVECVRRIALTGFAVFIYPESSAQIAVVLLLAVIFMVVSEILCPFVRPVEMWLYRAGHYVVFASMYLALLLRVDVSSERTQSQEVFSGVLVIAHVTMILVVIAQGVFVFMGWGDLLETPVALQRLRVEDDATPVNVRVLNPANSDEGFRSVTNGDTIDDVCVDDCGGQPQEEKREKKWETWVRPAPRAKSSFFQNPPKNECQKMPRTSDTSSAPTTEKPSQAKNLSPLEERQMGRCSLSCPRVFDAPYVDGDDEKGICRSIARRNVLSNVDEPIMPRQYQPDPNKDLGEPGRTTARTSWSRPGARTVWTPTNTLVRSSATSRTQVQPVSERPVSLPLMNTNRATRAPFDGTLAHPDERGALSQDPESFPLGPRPLSSTVRKNAWKPLSRQFHSAIIEIRSRDGSTGPMRFSESPPSPSRRSARSLSPRSSRSLRSRTSSPIKKQASAIDDTRSITGNQVATFGHIFNGRRRRDAAAASDNPAVVNRDDQANSRGGSPNTSPSAMSPIEGFGVKRGSVCSEQSSIGMAGVGALYLQRHRRASVGPGSAASWNRLTISDSGRSETTGYSIGSQENFSPLSRLRGRTTFMTALSPHNEESRNVELSSGWGANPESAAGRRMVRVTRKYKSLSPRSFGKNSSIDAESEPDQHNAEAGLTNAVTSFPSGHLDQLYKYRSFNPKRGFPQKRFLRATASIAGGPQDANGDGPQATQGFVGQHRNRSFAEHDVKQIVTTPTVEPLLKNKKSRRRILHDAIAITPNSGTSEIGASTFHAGAPTQDSPPNSTDKKATKAAADSVAVRRPLMRATTSVVDTGSTMGASGIIQALSFSGRASCSRSAEGNVKSPWASEGIGIFSVPDAALRINGVPKGGRERAGSEGGVCTRELPTVKKLRPSKGIPTYDCEGVSLPSDGMERAGRRAAVKQGWERRFPPSQDSLDTPE